MLLIPFILYAKYFFDFLKKLSGLLSRNVFWYYEEVKNQPSSNLECSRKLLNNGLKFIQKRKLS